MGGGRPSSREREMCALLLAKKGRYKLPSRCCCAKATAAAASAFRPPLQPRLLGAN